MKLGVSSYSFSRYIREQGATLADICRLSADMGFDAIEFTTLSGEDRLKQAAALRETCRSLGIDVCAYTVGADLALPDGRNAVEALCREVDIAAALGAPLMRHDVCFSLPDDMSWERAIERMVPRIRAVTAYAKERGIRTCTENHGYIFQDSGRVRRLIEAVNDANYGWLVDVGNFLCVDEAPLDAVRCAAPYAFHTHAKDFYGYPTSASAPEGSFRTRGGHALVGTVVGRGCVPVADCIRLLGQAGYDGVVSLEFEGREDVLSAIDEGGRYLRALIK